MVFASGWAWGFDISKLNTVPNDRTYGELQRNCSICFSGSLPNNVKRRYRWRTLVIRSSYKVGTYWAAGCKFNGRLKLTVSQLVKKYFSFYRTWRFITAFTWARHLSLSWARSIQSMPPPPNPSSWRFILILFLPSTPWVFQVVSFPQFSPPKPCMHLSSPPYMLYASPISFVSIWSPE